MKLFRLNAEYEIEPEKDTIMLVPEFAALWTLKYNKGTGDHDGRERKRGQAELTFLYFYCDYRSEFSELNVSERKEAALNAAGLPEDYAISGTLDAARVKYLEMQETRELKLLTSAYGTIDKLRDYFDNVVIDDKNAKNTLESLAKVGTVLTGLKKLEEQVRKQEQKEGGIRGDSEKGFLD